MFHNFKGVFQCQSDLKQTPLYQNYVDRGAKIVEFGGWAMPVQFSSIKEEHNAVDTKLACLMLVIWVN
ncbi:hypothetical protein ACVPOS_13065 [Staphylococcus aureus]